MKEQGLGKKLVIILFLLVMLIFVAASVIIALIVSVTTILMGGEEEEQKRTIVNTVSPSINISEEAESYREAVLKEAEQYGTEEYIELFLAVIMQESGGRGEDIFQCSESLGKEPNSITKEESIAQGVKYLSGMIEKAGVTATDDIEHIRIALHGYNFGGGYIDYVNEHCGGNWSQSNVFAYAQIRSGGARNTGDRVTILGPWAYGDQYYSDHVLRYYKTEVVLSADAGEAAKIPLEERIDWLFPEGKPHIPEAMQKYLTQITVPIINQYGEDTTMVLTVHIKLSEEIKLVFEEIRAVGFKVRTTDTSGYNWRPMANGSGELSHHSYGCVVDMNWTSNGAPYTPWGYNPGVDEFSVTEEIVNIWKSHGFYWGGDWDDESFDPMHFTYTNH